MEKKLEDIKFSLSPKMAQALIDFNDTKKELNDLRKLYKSNKNKDLLIKIEKKEKELMEFRNQFIEQFRFFNMDSIKEYLEIKKSIE